MSFLDTAYRLGANAALHDFHVKYALDISAGTGAPMPSQMPTSGTGNPVQQPTQGSGRPSPMPTDGGVAKLSEFPIMGPELGREPPSNPPPPPTPEPPKAPSFPEEDRRPSPPSTYPPVPSPGFPGKKTGAARDFFGSFLERDYDNPTDAPRKTAAEYAVEKALEKLGEPRGRKVKPGSRKGGRSEPASHAPAGKGTRFKALKAKLSRKKGVKDPGALAAAIGRSKFGKGGFQHMAAKGR